MIKITKTISPCLACLVSYLFCATNCFASIYDSLWKAEEYFDDPQQVALCKAIEKADLTEVDRLIKTGADVNARGKDGMTALLWAYPMGEKVLEHIIEKGADPNTQYDDGFGTMGMVEPGDSLLFIAIKSTQGKPTKDNTRFKNYIDMLVSVNINLERLINDSKSKKFYSIHERQASRLLPSSQCPA